MTPLMRSDCLYSSGIEKEKKCGITVSTADKPFTFTGFFCENHKDEVKTPWDDIMID
jgi:hypothetical protein